MAAVWITGCGKGLEWKVRAQSGGAAVGQVLDGNGVDPRVVPMAV